MHILLPSVCLSLAISVDNKGTKSKGSESITISRNKSQKTGSRNNQTRGKNSKP